MSYRRYDDYGGYDRRGYGGGGGGGWDDGYRGRDSRDRRDNYRRDYDDRDRGWDRRDRDRDRHGGGGRWGDDRRDRDRSFGGGGRGGGGGGFRRGGGGGRGGPPRGGKRPSDRINPDQMSKRAREDDHNWQETDRHPLMQACFMESLPEDFGEDWYFVVCPHGKRRFLVAANETTQNYNNNGNPSGKFRSCLPSGSEALKEVHKADDLTIFDAIFNGEAKKYYIIDMLHFKHYPYYDTEADFRFYCLTEKFSQLENPGVISENNEYSLELLPKVPYTPSAFQDALQQAKESSMKVEGVLFIQKSSLYETRDTTSCQWLRLDQTEAIFGFSPPEGLDFVVFSSKDEKMKRDQEERQRVKEQRDAVTEEAKRSEGDKDESTGKDGDGETEEQEEPDNGDNGGAGEGETYEEGAGDGQDYDYQNYTVDPEDGGMWKG